jgi:DNA (cytosine-5)-methyltransferase 1
MLLSTREFDSVRQATESPSVAKGAFSALDLFCGAGGFSNGLVTAGFRVAGAIDNWPIALATYRANFSHPVHQEDIAKLSSARLSRLTGLASGELGLLVGGPPCQGFSVQRIGSDTDQRNHLVLEFARVVEDFRPRLFFMENVPGLLGKRGHALVSLFLKKLERAGYSIEHRIINAAEYGVPQLRKRVVFAGWLKEQPAFTFPLPVFERDRFKSVAEAFAGLPEPPMDLTPCPGDRLHRRTKLSSLNQVRMEAIPPGGGMQDLPDSLKVACHLVGADKIGHRYVYGRLAPHLPASTITARFDSFTRGKFGHPVVARNITLREGARLQSFPDSFLFHGTQEEVAAQIGNAVPPMVSEVLAKAAYRYLNAIAKSPSVSGPKRNVRRNA